MKLKIVLSSLIASMCLSIFSFSETSYLKDLSLFNESETVKIFKPKIDKVLIKDDIKAGKYLGSKLISLKLVKINGIYNLYAEYDVDLQYTYSNIKVVRSVYYGLFHPILIENSKYHDFDIEEYISSGIMYDEDNPHLDFKTFEEVRSIDFEKIKYEDGEINISEDENKEEDLLIKDTLQYIPYITFDEKGYAYITGTDEKLTTNEVSKLIHYFSEDKMSLIEDVIFDNGRYISKKLVKKEGYEDIYNTFSDGEYTIKDIANFTIKNREIEQLDIIWKK